VTTAHGLYGGRVPADDLVTEAYGTTDEAVAVLGLTRSLTEDRDASGSLACNGSFSWLAPIRDQPPRAKEARGGGLTGHRSDGETTRTAIDDLTRSDHYHRCSSPGANAASAAIDAARAAIRRAERDVVALEHAQRE
jgi:cob(I)alamin adenosyltransferase